MKSLKSMNIEMLVSILNMKLRDSLETFDDICSDLDSEYEEVIEHLMKHGYRINQRRIERV